MAQNTAQASEQIDADAIERVVEDDAQMRALLRQRLDKKAKLARDTFGFE